MDNTNNNANTPQDNKGFLVKSGWVFIVLGVIALIVGLIIAETGIWIAGGTAIASGCYCLIKAKQLYPDPAKPAAPASGSKPTA